MGIFDRFKKRTSRRTAEEQLEVAFSYAGEALSRLGEDLTDQDRADAARSIPTF